MWRIDSLFFLFVSVVDSNQNLPSIVIFGAPLVFFFLFSSVFFLFPAILVSAKLRALFAKKGGIYHWVEQAFGQKAGLFAIWLQWIQGVTWFRAILTFLSATAAFLIDPNLVYSKAYVFSGTLLIFWTLTLLTFLGIRLSTKLVEVFCLIGTLTPTVVLLFLTALWVIKGWFFGRQNHP